MLELGDVHRRHAIDRRAALGGDRRQRGARVERRGRHDHRRTVDAAHHAAQHAAEAMVKRHRHADPVGCGIPQTLAGVKRVQKHVAMREHRPFGQSGRARGELDVVHVVGAHGPRARLERFGVAHAGRLHRRPTSTSPGRAVSKRDQSLQTRESVSSSNRASEAAATSGQSDSTIDTKFEPLNGLPDDQGRHVGHAQGVGELMNPVGGIDVDEDRADPARRRTG